MDKINERFDERDWSELSIKLRLSAKEIYHITKFFDDQIHKQVMKTINGLERRHI